MTLHFEERVAVWTRRSEERVEREGGVEVGGRYEGGLGRGWKGFGSFSFFNQNLKQTREVVHSSLELFLEITASDRVLFCGRECHSCMPSLLFVEVGLLRGGLGRCLKFMATRLSCNLQNGSYPSCFEASKCAGSKCTHHALSKFIVQYPEGK